MFNNLHINYASPERNTYVLTTLSSTTCRLIPPPVSAGYGRVGVFRKNWTYPKRSTQELMSAVSTQTKINVVLAIESGIRQQIIADAHGLSREQTQEKRKKRRPERPAGASFSILTPSPMDTEILREYIQAFPMNFRERILRKSPEETAREAAADATGLSDKTECATAWMRGTRGEKRHPSPAERSRESRPR